MAATRSPADEFPVHGVVLVVAVEGDPPADGRPDDEDQPRQTHLRDLHVQLRRGRIRDHLLVRRRRLLGKGESGKSS